MRREGPVLAWFWFAAPPPVSRETDVEIEAIGPVRGVQTIARERGIRELGPLVKLYGPGRWRKCKGIATVRLPDGSVCTAEVHWYEAHGIGRKDFKIKHILDEAR